MTSPDSPIDTVSPSPSTPSSGTPPPDDMLIESTMLDQMSVPLLASPAHGQGKRRLPSGALATPSRDAKTRRRDDIGGKRLGAGPSGWAESRGMEPSIKSQRDELIDTELVERLRFEFGDIFDDAPLKTTH